MSLTKLHIVTKTMLSNIIYTFVKLISKVMEVPFVELIFSNENMLNKACAYR